MKLCADLLLQPTLGFLSVEFPVKMEMSSFLKLAIFSQDHVPASQLAYQLTRTPEKLLVFPASISDALLVDEERLKIYWPCVDIGIWHW